MPQLVGGKYDPEIETEVLSWFKTLLDTEIPSGQQKVEKALKNGIDLIRLAAEVQKGTPNCPAKAKKMKLKPNTQNAPFKQMENITNFIKFVENYGVDRQGTFQTVDLFEARNMPQVLNCIQQLGTECQRQGFTGPTIGPPPTTACAREFSAEQVAAGKAIIGLQAGSNKGASQSGMSMGAGRTTSEKVPEMVGGNVLGLQMGSNKGASQTGMSMGAGRTTSDQVPEMVGGNVLGLQMGSNKGASQTGMSMGAGRTTSEKVPEMVGGDVLGLQMGSNKGASQTGMSMGAGRTSSDVPEMVGGNVLGLQMGSNQGASQKGMAMGGARHAGDIATAAGDQGSIGLQMGSNKGASQSGMAMGGARHAGDISTGAGVGSDVIGLQSGTNQGASQSGQGTGGRHDVR